MSTSKIKAARSAVDASAYDPTFRDVYPVAVALISIAKSLKKLAAYFEKW